MATKKPRVSKAKPSTPAPRRLENLAARPAIFDDTIDEQLVDHSGVFRVTSQIAQAQTGHGDDAAPRFANESLVMAAQRDGRRDGRRDEGSTGDEAVDEQALVDEAALAVKRQRLITLAARAQRAPTRKR